LIEGVMKQINDYDSERRINGTN
ncbi:hypothetical protein Q604_UNBC08113G0002, partial [human gut metagenome]